ncbi:MAG: DMT family transporter [Rhodoferax sp.]|nr:DMT family transporter [Rhodoferax sp.]
MTHRFQRPLAYLCLAMSMSLVGVYVALSKPLVAAIPVFLLGWMRFGIAAVAMAGWLKKPATEAPLDRRTRILLFFESFLGNFMFSICMLFGVSMTSTVSAGVILAAIPAVSALMSGIFLKERMGLRIWLAVACGVLGMALLSLAKQPASADLNAADADRALWGNLLVFGAVVCEAAYIVIGKRLTANISPKRIAAMINLYGLALMTPAGLYYALQFDFTAVRAESWGLLVFYALAASVGTVWLWMTGMQTIPAAQAGVFSVMLPVTAAAIGALFLKESFSLVQAGAFAVALLGLLLATLPARRRPAAEI